MRLTHVLICGRERRHGEKCLEERMQFELNLKQRSVCNSLQVHYSAFIGSNGEQKASYGIGRNFTRIWLLE